MVKWAEKILSRARQGGVSIPNGDERQKFLKLGPAGAAPVEGGVVSKKDNAAAAA